MIKISITNHSTNPLPSYATPDAAGMDLRAFLEVPLTLQPNEHCLVPTGLSIAIPQGYEGQVRPRSGLAAKHGITVLNSPGTIDADYRGELKVILINLSQQPFAIENGERIAQLVIAPYTKASWQEVPSLDTTSRGSGGFGSTGRS